MTGPYSTPLGSVSIPATYVPAGASMQTPTPPTCAPATAPERHPAIAGVLRYFAWEHLPERLQAVSRPFGELAEHMVDTLRSGPELTAGLRKLLEAKDCAVRAALDS